MKKFSLLKLVVVILAFALAGMASAQLSLSSAIYSEEKTNFEAPATLGMYIYARDERQYTFGSYNASCGIEPSIIRGSELDIMLVDFNTKIEEISLTFAHPLTLLDNERLKQMNEDDSIWCKGKKSDTAFLFSVDTRGLPPGHNVAILRCKTKTRNRHSFLVLIRWVTTGRETKDREFALMVQDPPYGGEGMSLENFMQVGLFSGFRPTRAVLPADPMRTINQVIPGQSSTAGSQQTQGSNVLPPDLDLPGSNNANNLLASQGGSGLPPDLSLPEAKKLPDFFIRFSNERLGREVGKLANGELEEAMRTPHGGNTVAISKAQATIYVWSDEFFEGEIRCGDNSVKLAVYRHSNGKYWARICGATSVLPDSKLVLKSGGHTRTIAFTPEVK
jgi:hypothetical protein